MHDVEAEFVCDIVDRYRQRERIWGVFEEGVVIHLHFVEIEPLPKASEPEGLRIRDEVYLVTSICEGETKLRGHCARASVRRVTGDSDLHMAPR
jgi:hypothetical protein